MSKNIFQKVSKSGKPVVKKRTGLPIYTKPVNFRIATIKQILTINMNKDDAKWFLIKNELKTVL